MRAFGDEPVKKQKKGERNKMVVGWLFLKGIEKERYVLMLKDS